MAAVTERVVVIRQGTVWIEITYDDVTDRMASVTTHNPLPTPIGRVNQHHPVDRHYPGYRRHGHRKRPRGEGSPQDRRHPIGLGHHRLGG
jgi:hypothetical protein